MTYTDEELLDTLREFADELGHSPSVPETNARKGLPGADTFVRHFGTWNDALSAADLSTREQGHRETDDHDPLNGASLSKHRFCSQCGRLFYRQAGLEKHLESEHGHGHDDHGEVREEKS